MPQINSKTVEVLTQRTKDVLEDWLRAQLASATLRLDLVSENELRKQSHDFLTLFATACEASKLQDINTPQWDEAPHWKEVREYLSSITFSRARQGFSSSETATFVLSLKQPLFSHLRQLMNSNSEELIETMWTVTVLIDKLALLSTENYQQGREEIIRRQQQELLELSTPVVKAWDGVLILPLIGTLDSARTQIIMENLLQTILDSGSALAIVDITGVTTVDTLVAQHLLKTIAAAKLMGADCIISGIRPQIAQTMVHLGVGFGEVATKASLADALAESFKRLGLTVGSLQAPA
ncbi:STAS domain-containing protein [Candidatus Methylobacter favarea]|nr:STAS domain-containing protein [Candidatus Methylobacter favarea]